MLASADAVKRFKAEAEAAAALEHPNIVSIYEIGEHGGQPYFSMAFVDGPTLGQAVTRSADFQSAVPPTSSRQATDRSERSRPDERAAGWKPAKQQTGCLRDSAREGARLLATIARAVHFAHQRGVPHRNLKPGNILLDPHGEPHLTDFGLAKFIRKESTLTHTNAVLGTPAYMSPEQARGDAKAVTTATDVYGLGAVLYETLTGTPPFAGGTPLETIRQVLDEEPRPPSALNPGVDRDLETICLKCLEKEPLRRYGSAEALAEDLERWLRHEPILARPSTVVTRVVKWVRRKPAVAALVGALTFAPALRLAGVLWQWLRAERHAAAEGREHRRAEANVYATDVQLASKELGEQDLAGARKRLQRIAASPEQRGMRSWEWRYLMDRCRVDDSILLGRHESWIFDLAISSDDKWVASISGDGVVKLWDFAGRTNVAAWKAHAATADRRPGFLTHALAFSLDSRLLATGGEDKLVCLWDVLSPEKKDAVDALGGSCSGVAFAAGGRLLAAVSSAGAAYLLRACLETLRKRRVRARGLQISSEMTPCCRPGPPTGRVFKQALSLSNGAMAVSTKWNTKRIAQDPAFMPDGKSLVIAGYQKAVTVWDAFAPETNQLVRTFTGSAAPAAISPDGRWLVTGVAGQHLLKRWSLPTGREDKTWRGRPASFVRLAISGDSRVLAAGLGDGTIMLWDMAGELEPQTLMAHDDVVTGLAFSHHGHSLLSASLDGSVRVWDGSLTRRRQLEARLAHGIAAIAVSFSRDSRYLASVAREQVGKTGEEQHTLRLWDMSTRTEVARALVGGKAASAETAFSPDGRFVAADDWGGTLRLYRVPGLELVADLKGHLARFLPDGRSFIYASENRLLRRGLPGATDTAENVSGNVGQASSLPVHGASWPRHSGGRMPPEPADRMSAPHFQTRSEALIGEESGNVIAMTVSPDGRIAAASSQGDDGVSVHLWDVESRRLIGPLVGRSGRVHRLAFSPDGQKLASASWDGTVRLWDVGRRRNLAILQGHSDEVYGVAFSLDGRTVASCGADAVRLWNAATSRQIAVLETGGLLKCVAFSPDGQWLAGAANDGTVRLWRAPSFKEIETSVDANATAS